MPKSLPRCYILPSLSMATALLHSSTIAYLGLWYNRRAVASFCFSPPLTTSCQLLHTVPAPAAHDHFLKLRNFFEYVQQLRVQRGPVLLLHFVVCVQQLLPERTDAEVGLVRDVIHARARLHPAAAGRPQATHNSKQAGVAAAVASVSANMTSPAEEHAYMLRLLHKCTAGMMSVALHEERLQHLVRRAHAVNLHDLLKHAAERRHHPALLHCRALVKRHLLPVPNNPLLCTARYCPSLRHCSSTNSQEAHRHTHDFRNSMQCLLAFPAWREEKKLNGSILNNGTVTIWSMQPSHDMTGTADSCLQAAANQMQSGQHAAAAGGWVVVREV